MTFKKFGISGCLLLIFTFSCFSQHRLGGKVIEIIDGKTAVVKLSNGLNLTVILQYIEVPEYDQPLSQIVKDHLEKLILNKSVQINPRGIKDDKTVGQLTANGIDIAQQMIRDGAAWHAVLEKNGQNLNESTNYQNQEALAKAEKRGIWSVENMVPAWEFRHARAEALKQAEREALEKIKREAIAAREQTETSESTRSYRAKQRELVNSDQVIWANPNIDFSDIPDAKGLIKGILPAFGKEITMTSSAFYELSNGKDIRIVESRTMFLGTVTGAKEMVSIGFRSRSETNSFQTSNNLTIVADGQKFDLGKAVRQEHKEGKYFEEMLIYYFDTNILTSIATADRVKFSLGGYSAEISPKSHEAHKNLFLQFAK